MALNSDGDFSNQDLTIEEKEYTDLFLDLIKERPLIYDKSLKEHHNKMFIEIAFEEIARILNDQVGNCDQLWKKMLSKYHAEKVAREKESRSGSGFSNRMKWPYFERMHSMLSTCNAGRKTITNVSDEAKAEKFSCQAANTKKKKKCDAPNPVETAFNSFNLKLDTLMQTEKSEKSSKNVGKSLHDLIGDVINSKLNELSPQKAKKTRKRILKYVVEFDSDDE